MSLQSEETERNKIRESNGSSAGTHQYSLNWSGINVSIELKKNKEKQILFDQKGSASTGQVVAIIGASGSGKTTLMNYLSGFIGPEFKSEGSIFVGDTKVSNKIIRGISGYVLQEDILQTQLTVYENIEYSARFRLEGKKVNFKERVEKTLEMLNLEKCKNTKIGTEFDRGVSGGEKKRCCIAMELVNEPSILFLDEPTTGLDSVNAEDVVTCLRDLAKRGKIIISTIHQPSVDLLKMFDKLIIMHEGMAVYSGHYDAMHAFYESHGVVIPPYVNQVEYILTCLNMNESNCQVLSEASADQKTNYFDFKTVEAVKKVCIEARSTITKSKADEEIKTDYGYVKDLIKNSKVQKNGFLSSLLVQFSRSFKCYFRDRRTFLAQVFTNITYVLLAMILFRDLTTDIVGRQNRTGVLYYLMMIAVMTMIQITSMTFSTGTVVLRKELMQGQYTPSSYFLGVTIPPDIPTLIIMLASTLGIYFVANLNRAYPMKIVNFALIIVGSIQAGEGMGHILAAIFTDPTKTVAALPMFLMPLQLFSGFLFNLDSIPWVVKPLSWISIFKYSLEGLITNEFTDLNCSDGYDCNQFPSTKGYHNSVATSIIYLFSIGIGCRILSLIIFHLKYRKYYEL